MTIAELKARREELRKENQGLRETATTEKRALKAEELDKINANVNELSSIGEDIVMQESEMREARKGVKPQKQGKTLRALFKELADGGMRNVDIATVEHETRAADFDVTTSGSTAAGLVGTTIMDIGASLKARMLLGQAGATMLTGLKDNLSLPVYSGCTSAWSPENGTAASGKGTFTYVSMSPKRLTSKISISRQLLEQDTLGVEALLQQELVDSIAEKLESTVLGGAAGTTTTPAGIFNGVGAAVDFTYENVVDMETSVEGGNALADGCQYLMSHNLWGLGKVTPKVAGEGAGMIVEAGGVVNGYKAQRSTNVHKSGTNYGVAFGDWKELYIGQWGAIRVTVDPYTSAGEDMVNFVVSSFWDAKVRKSAAIVTKLMKKVVPATT